MRLHLHKAGLRLRSSGVSYEILSGSQVLISGNAHGEVLSIDDVANFLRRSLVGHDALAHRVLGFAAFGDHPDHLRGAMYPLTSERRIITRRGSGPRPQTRRLNPVGFSFALVGPGDLLALPVRPRVSRCDRFRRPGKSSGPPPVAPSLNVQGDDTHNNSGFSVI